MSTVSRAATSYRTATTDRLRRTAERVMAHLAHETSPRHRAALTTTLRFVAAELRRRGGEAR